MNIRFANDNDIKQFSVLMLKMMEYHRGYSVIYDYENLEETSIEEIISDYLKDTQSKIFLAEDGPKIFGYIMCKKIERPKIFKLKSKAVIDGLFVDEDFRNHKAGKLLLDKALEWMSDMDYIELLFHKDNEAAKGFWTKNGFKPILEYCLKVK